MSQRIDGPDEAENPHVAVGRDGWLFLRRGTNDVAAQISGRFPLPAEFDEQWRRLLQRRRDYCNGIGAQYLFFVAPNKECVHSDLLPPDMRVVETRPVARVLNAAAGLVPAIYPVAEFRRAAGHQQLYALQDSHWRREGLVLAYRIIMRHLGLAALDDADIVALDGPMNDLGKKIGRADRREPVALRAREERHRIVEDNRIKPVGNLIISEVDDESLPTAVIFRDSFLTHMHGLLAQHFRRLVFVWQANLDRTIIERERPDFVVSQQAERFLVQCPDDENGLTNAQHVAAKMMA